MREGFHGTRKIALISMLTAAGLVIFVFESFLPVLPWFRPGLGNIATILALLFFGFGDAFRVTVLRVFLGALVLGRLFTPIFVFAFAGGLASVAVMGAAKKFTGGTLGPVGLSVLGAVAHNSVQIVTAYAVFVRSGAIFTFLPVYSLAGVATGILTGLVSAVLYEKSRRRLDLASFS